MYARELNGARSTFVETPFGDNKPLNHRSDMWLLIAYHLHALMRFVRHANAMKSESICDMATVLHYYPTFLHDNHGRNSGAGVMVMFSLLLSVEFDIEVLVVNCERIMERMIHVRAPVFKAIALALWRDLIGQYIVIVNFITRQPQCHNLMHALMQRCTVMTIYMHIVLIDTHSLLASKQLSRA